MTADSAKVTSANAPGSFSTNASPPVRSGWVGTSDRPSRPTRQNQYATSSIRHSQPITSARKIGRTTYANHQPPKPSAPSAPSRPRQRIVLHDGLVDERPRDRCTEDEHPRQRRIAKPANVGSRLFEAGRAGPGPTMPLDTNCAASGVPRDAARPRRGRAAGSPAGSAHGRRSAAAAAPRHRRAAAARRSRPRRRSVPTSAARGTRRDDRPRCRPPVRGAAGGTSAAEARCRRARTSALSDVGKNARAAGREAEADGPGTPQGRPDPTNGRAVRSRRGSRVRRYVSLHPPQSGFARESPRRRSLRRHDFRSSSRPGCRR